MYAACKHCDREVDPRKPECTCQSAVRERFNREMEALERKRVARQHWPDCALNHGGAECDMGPECGDTCPDGPHCGCELHRGEYDE